ncbi:MULTISPECIES: hypothetical protein [Pseudomonas]|uniref:Uncharacterized protein n=1 Tax=Pseudomonas chlororaphis TaxID=587753 RepID=A0AAP9VX85_9PSED|nr:MULTISPECIES: hypothetical protein [Pseudomonas]AIC22227.1 hypothetical protein EY04_25890 [Pseudomonas chlororaphis]AUG43024.1 hypothetical protein CXP47_25100 [Pseudomonas chlororaphis]AZD94776.1 hypothetical protein C4K13_5383 [Pseudomonas chlororaphis subsp. aureofaciens]AZE01103.1 hypothetical protein C4K12_5260 [Pseudomonas chlororaphis subsp. aureofaciens]AZE07215.1 hypothetical protein C4K11_5077 [Pseudomonas chlororaphis subsp. aureofaciens]
MNLSPLIKDILLVLIVIGLLAYGSLSRTPAVRLGEGGPRGGFLIGHGRELTAGSDAIAHAF